MNCENGKHGINLQGVEIKGCECGARVEVVCHLELPFTKKNLGTSDWFQMFAMNVGILLRHGEPEIVENLVSALQSIVRENFEKDMECKIQKLAKNFGVSH